VDAIVGNDTSFLRLKAEPAPEAMGGGRATALPPLVHLSEYL